MRWGRPGGRKQQHRVAVEAAAAAGVRHIVYTSGPAPHPDPEFAIADDHYWSEQAIAASSVGGWTMLRNNLYAEVALMGLTNAVASGKLMTATHGGARSYVTREDCARVAAAALADSFEGNRILDVTGPAAVTQAELAELASAITGRDIELVDMSAEALGEAFGGFGMPQPVVAMMVGFDREAAQGYYAVTTRVVETLTGTPPMAMKTFLEQNRSALLGEKA